jgi:glutamate synthase (NADPH/NADH) small chain
MPIFPRTTLEKANRAFAEKEPAYSPQQALVEANRCLYCFDAPCIDSCPTGIDIPGFIKKIAEGNPRGAAKLILEANILGASCARVCPTRVLCEGACVVLDKEGDPVKIGRLQRYATDAVANNPASLFTPPKNKTGKHIGIIGAGPAGLGCAAELAQLGHQVTVYEQKPQGGGLNTYGIAYYKMRPQVSLDEVALVESLGVTFQYNTKIGKDITAEMLLKKHDAVFIGIGLGHTQALGIPGENASGIIDAITFIEQIRTKPLDQIPIGAHVAIIGCGNTAIDAATQSKRLGAETVTIIYRRDQSNMSAYDFEYALARKDGVQFLFHTAPLEAITDSQGNIQYLKLIRTRIAANEKLETIPGSEFQIPCDMLIKANGQQKQTSWLSQQFPTLKIDSKGRIEYDSATGQTSDPRIFTGGDCANGGREVVNAVAEGKKAAHGIHAKLTQQKALLPIQPTRLGSPRPPRGAGIENPVRVPELEALYYQNKK